MVAELSRGSIGIMNAPHTATLRIAIVGAGFGGLAAAMTLGRALRRVPAGTRLRRNAAHTQEYDIVLIDRNAEHVYTLGLYEAVTTLRKFAEPIVLKRAATIPTAAAVAGLPIRFVQDAVTHIDAKTLRIPECTFEVESPWSSRADTETIYACQIFRICERFGMMDTC